jgi:hypothetical protein
MLWLISGHPKQEHKISRYFVLACVEKSYTSPSKKSFSDKI